ncbi:MAG: putative sugar kinase YdjH [candidate division WS2 bacterium ADurb.Bin280]|uniref:Putative sugar kinase YdjH n=1 Tax=candidate division WS2 bacterium ADurb.Bin280 TaxID=1852829 RepID=A0A1V5SFJ1_9BACT|nr:MAG: putative sugar kinase YdjH [candidate division WS2 bacterium ADurb.Bin280]
MENLSICTIGDTTIDRFFMLDKGEAELFCSKGHCEISFGHGEKISIEKYKKSFGGSALNTAIGFSRLSVKSSIATIVGEDEDGEQIISFLSKNGVNTSLIKKQEDTNQSAILVYAGERTIFSYHKNRDYGQIEIPNTNWLYLSSAGDGFAKMIPQIDSKVKAGAKIAINPGSSLIENFENLEKLINVCEILFLNRQEATMLFKTEKINEQIDEVLKQGPKTAVITDGANGAYVANATTRFHMGIMPSRLVDQTGAGDSFSCAFTASHAQGMSLEESSRWGMVNSSSVIEKIGANDGLLNEKQIREIVGSSPILKAVDL